MEVGEVVRGGRSTAPPRGYLLNAQYEGGAVDDRSTGSGHGNRVIARRRAGTTVTAAASAPAADTRDEEGERQQA